MRTALGGNCAHFSLILLFWLAEVYVDDFTVWFYTSNQHAGNAHHFRPQFRVAWFAMIVPILPPCSPET